MGARWLTDLADVLRAAGLTVVEVDGWQTAARGSGGYDGDRPWCVAWHHTASSTTPANDVAYITAGSDNAPISNLYLARDGAVWVSAAGATNTNGKGDPLTFSRGTVPADSANTHALGVEAANNGVGEVWPEAQIDAYFRLNNALAEAYGLLPTDLFTHALYAPGRKIDPATAGAVQGTWKPAAVNSSGTWDYHDVRAEAVARSSEQPPPPPPPPEGDDVRISPFLIQTTDGTGRVYCTDGQLMTYRRLHDEAALAGYRWTARDASPGIEKAYPELVDGAPIRPVDDLAAYGILIE